MHRHHLAREQAITLLLFGALFMLSVSTTTDPDLWWHLRTGETILSDGIPRADIFSFTVPGREWITHEWGSQVIMWLLYDLGGLAALMIVFSLITTVAFGLVYAVSPGKPRAAGVVCALAAFATHIAVGSRPQMFNLLGVATVVFLLERLRAGQLDPRRLWILPVIVAVWANLHSGFLLGIATMCAYALGEHLQRRFAHDESALPLAVSRRLGVMAGLSFFAAVLNPSGPKLWLYPLTTLRSGAMREYIQEWHSPDFHSPHFFPFAALLVLAVASLSLSRRRPTWTELLLLCGTAVAGLQSMRHIPIFAVVATPIIARHLDSAWDRARSVDRERPQLGALNWAMAGAGVLGAVMWISAALSVNDTAIAEEYPVAAVDYLVETGLADQNGFNAYQWGGYLIWRSVPVFIDGRADVYGD
ncbi:MAG: hypothetical protein KDB21_07430, partial [Acidimicrobiales bacterium]|nr:hypothetical protein [Acidimicrobiales bacterium]